MLLEQVYENAPAVKSGKHYTTVNEFTDQQPALRPEVLAEARDRLCELGQFDADKILVEEDKGAILGAAICLAKKLPLAVARWYSYELNHALTASIKSEYFSGKLYVNYDARVQTTWERDIPGHIKAADANWPGLLAKD